MQNCPLLGTTVEGFYIPGNTVIGSVLLEIVRAVAGPQHLTSPEEKQGKVTNSPAHLGPWPGSEPTREQRRLFLVPKLKQHMCSPEQNPEEPGRRCLSVFVEEQTCNFARSLHTGEERGVT